MGAGLGVSGARGVIHSFIYLFFLIVILFHLLRFGFVIGVFLFYYFIFFLFRLIIVIIIFFFLGGVVGEMKRGCAEIFKESTAYRRGCAVGVFWWGGCIGEKMEVQWGWGQRGVSVMGCGDGEGRVRCASMWGRGVGGTGRGSGAL